MFEQACSTFLGADNGANNPEKKYAGVLDLIETLAHELYHKRQATFFPRFFNSRSDPQRYIVNDNKKYRNQIIEIGARAFAKRYMASLTEGLEDTDNSEWAKGLRGHKSLDDIDLELISVFDKLQIMIDELLLKLGES